MADLRCFIYPLPLPENGVVAVVAYTPAEAHARFRALAVDNPGVSFLRHDETPQHHEVDLTSRGATWIDR